MHKVLVVKGSLEYCKNNRVLQLTKFLKNDFNRNLNLFGCQGYDDRMLKTTVDAMFIENLFRQKFTQLDLVVKHTVLMSDVY